MTTDTDLALTTALLRDGFGRIHEDLAHVIEGLSTEELRWRPDAASNPVGWLVWHLSRQQDDQLAALAGTDPVWRSAGWADRFALPYPPRAHGYGMSAEEVGALAVEDPALLTGYHDDVHDLTLRLVEDLTAERLGEVVDSSWDPPVTVAVRVYSVLEDAAKHLGQAEYVRGLLLRRR